MDPGRWPRALELLTRPPLRAALTEPLRLRLPDGGRADVPSYTAWWLRRHLLLGGRRPGDLRAGDSDPLLAGLYDVIGAPGATDTGGTFARVLADPAVTRALGVRVSLTGLLAEPGGADELLARLADPDRLVTRPQLRSLWSALATADGLTADRLSPPDRVRAVHGDKSPSPTPTTCSSSTPPTYGRSPRTGRSSWHPYEHAVRLADLLDLPLASEEIAGAVESDGEFRPVPDVVREVLPDVDRHSGHPRPRRALSAGREARRFHPPRIGYAVVGEFAEMSPAPPQVKAHMAAAGMLAEFKPSDRSIAFRDFIDNDGRYQVHPLGDVKEALAVIAYTGGTTGTPKGAMLTHADLTAACSLYMEVMTRSGPCDSLARSGGAFSVHPAAVSDIYSLTVVMLLGFRLGAELVLHPRFDPVAAIKDIVDKKITVYMGVPTMHVALLDAPGAEWIHWSSLRLCASGGRPLPVAVQQRFEECRLPSEREGWGMTETAPIGTFTPRTGPQKPGSCGVPSIPPPR